MHHRHSLMAVDGVIHSLTEVLHRHFITDTSVIRSMSSVNSSVAATHLLTSSETVSMEQVMWLLSVRSVHMK